jgi:bromodomain-containing factor 1
MNPRRPEEFAKPEGLSENPPTPDPEHQPFESRNLGAVASNAEAPEMSLPSKPIFNTPPAVETMTDAPLQPVQEILTNTEVPAERLTSMEDSSDPTVHSSVSLDPPHQNGLASDNPLPPTNGTPSVHMNGNINSPPVSDIPQMEGTTVAATLPAPSSSLPASSSFDSFAPSSTHVETQNTVTTAATEGPLEALSELQLAPEQAPTSDVRTSPRPLPQDSEPALRIKNDKHEKELANDPELAQGLAAGGDAPIGRMDSPEAPPASMDYQSTPAASAPTSLDASAREAPTITNEIIPPASQAPAQAHSILPADEPMVPAAPGTSMVSDHLQVDQPMVDAPPSPGKVSRERDEEGDEEGPAAKRLKAQEKADDEARPEFKVPEPPARPLIADKRINEQLAPEDDIIHPARLAHMKRIIANLKKSSISQAFREPVDVVALKIPHYLDTIKKPMDLGTIDRKLKSSSYQKLSEFFADFNLIVDNTIDFNGPTHVISEAGIKMRANFERQLRLMPGPEFAVTAKDEKKSSKTKEHPVRTSSQRRPSASQVAATASARSPTTPGSATTFALGPEGMPLIRRDSTVGDGRPKRAIHPPKRRDHEFGPGRPRKKKFEWQLKFCKEVINEMKKPKHYQFGQFFYQPVDAVALNIPTYHKVVKKPMDLETVERKLDTNQYERARDFEEDIRLIFKNCFLFNNPGEFVYTAGEQFEKVLDDKWATKDEWLASHEPASEPQSAGDEDEEHEASEDEEDDSADERTDEIAQLKAQIAMMSQTIGNLQSAPKKKGKPTPPAPAGSKKSGKAKKKDKPATIAAPPQASKDKKKSSSKSKPEKEHFVSYNEKQYISTGISSLPDARMSEALKIIQSNVPSLKNTHETEIELDIDELPNHVLLKLLTFVKRYGEHAPPEAEPPQQPSYAPSVSAPGKPKKNKPMSKQEQEQQIRDLKGKLGVYDGGQRSHDPSKSIWMISSGAKLTKSSVRSAENAVDSSDDGDSDEESEEE